LVETKLQQTAILQFSFQTQTLQVRFWEYR